MSIPYIPGIGDTLSADLPKLGQSLSRIMNPYQEEQIALRKMLITNPESLDQYINTEQENPGFARAIGGKGFEGFVRGRDTSEGFKRNIQKEKLSIQQQQESIVSTQTNTKRLQQLIQQRDEQEKIIADVMKHDPDTARKLRQKLDLGTTEDEIQNLKNQIGFDTTRLSDIEGAKNLKEPFDPRRMLGSYKGKKQYTPEEAGLYLNQDTNIGKASSLIFQDYLARQRDIDRMNLEEYRQGKIDERKAKEQKKAIDAAITKSNNVINNLLKSARSSGKNKLTDDDMRALAPQIQNELDHQRFLMEQIGEPIDDRRVIFEKAGRFQFGKKSGLRVVGSDGKEVDTYKDVESEKVGKPKGVSTADAFGGKVDNTKTLGSHNQTDEKIIQDYMSGELDDKKLNQLVEEAKVRGIGDFTPEWADRIRAEARKRKGK